jgi:cell division protein FtsB
VNFQTIKEYKYLILFIIILTLVLFLLQYKIWFGEFRNAKLASIQEEIKTLEQENQKLKILNKDLEKEKMRLSAGKEAIEGIARRELGLIKPNEVFYRFPDKEPKSEN